MVTIKGLQKTCLVDYEPYTACVVFLAGCNFRCGYCHNPDLVLRPNEIDTIKEEEFFSFLDSRKKWIDGVVISGGEPCAYKDLPSFASKIKEKGFLVKLDTNGSNPILLKELLDKKLLDRVAMDIKTSLDDYNAVIGFEINPAKIKRSIDLIKESDIEYDFRTTVVPGLITKENVVKIGELLKGSKKFTIQNFRDKTDMIETRFKNVKPYSTEELEEMKESIKDCFDEVVIKN
jgi:pyruvate formate lyase activating enzyme|tara:strand:+ start:1041 stop:1739 length:699 start_codon:yes stop_codon:yes gene_type:complete